MGKTNTHAVVIGGGMAGMVTARVLSEHFDAVELFERDRYPETPRPRKHVPQGQQIHVLLARGGMILESLFPALGDRLDALGATVKDFGADMIQYSGDIRMPRDYAGIPMRCASRPLLEWALHQELAGWPGVEIHESHQVRGLMMDRAGNVRGVHVADSKGVMRDVAADLVVDTAGRGSRLPRWLEEGGHGGVDEQVMDAGFRYASGLFRLHAPARLEGATVVGCSARAPDFPVAGGIMMLPDETALVTVITLRDHAPIVDRASMLAAFAEMPYPVLYELVQEAEMLTPVRPFNNTANRRRRYDAMAGWPGGLIAIGDGVCTLNPRFGQGMTVAAMCAQLLDEYLRGRDRAWLRARPRAWARGYMKKQARILDRAWSIATTEDAGWIPGRQSRVRERAMGWYLKRLMRYATGDSTTYFQWFRVAQMLDEPRVLFRPALAWRVICQGTGRP